MSDLEITVSATPPSNFLVFGAAGHIGGPAAEHLAARRPNTRIRLVTSRADHADALRTEHPTAEIRVANYLDAADMRTVFEGIEAAFVVTPDFLDEATAMGNIVDAIEQSDSLVRLIRLIGDPPGLREEAEVESAMSGYDAGTAVQHLRARTVLSASSTPVVYMNVAAWFMQDFATFLLPPIIRRRTLVMPYDRLMNYIDTRDIGRAAAELMLDPSRTEVGGTYHLHNGIDSYPFSHVAAVMTEVLGEKIDYDDSEEAFLRDLGDVFRDYMRRDDAAEYFLAYCQFELGHVRRLGADLLNGEPEITPQKLGFAPTTFRDWIAQHRAIFSAEQERQSV
jgi:uncharacterized protein YbjT (DUF2867 family)